MTNRRYTFCACLLFIFLMLSVNSRAQTMKTPIHDFWYDYNMKNVTRLNLQMLNSSDADNYFRIWFNLQTISYAIDIYKDQNSVKGFVTIYTNEVVDQTKEPPTNRTYFEKKVLSSNQADSIYKLITDTHIIEIPPDSVIKGWQHGFDGVTYAFEWVINDKYDFRYYWTPEAQENVKEAIVIKHFVDSVNSVIHSNESLKEFRKNVPFERYNSGGPSTAIRVETVEQMRQYRRERDKYRKEHHIEK